MKKSDIAIGRKYLIRLRKQRVPFKTWQTAMAICTAINPKANEITFIEKKVASWEPGIAHPRKAGEIYELTHVVPARHVRVEVHNPEGELI